MLGEVSFDGLVGPTHNYAGLSAGNLASERHEGAVSSPRAAALQGLAKMRFLRSLGVVQGVLPPHPRPHLSTLRRLGFAGSDAEVLAAAAERDGGHLLRLCSSAAAMWTANAATVAPSCDTADGRVHLTPANLQEMFHRAIEADATHRVLSRIFADGARFAVHAPLPGGGHFADEGAANHTRLATPGHDAVHLFAWGRTAWGTAPRPARFPARQTREASAALARLHQLRADRCLFPQQAPEGIDAGAFHTDVLAVGNENVLLVHEHAFAGLEALLSELRARLGASLHVEVASEAELPVADAALRYPFNSQVVTRPDGRMAIVAPADCAPGTASRRYLDRVVAGPSPIAELHTLDLRQSMNNGGGPACLRLRVPLTSAERAALGARVLFDDALDRDLVAIVERRYRDRLLPADLADPVFARECLETVDEVTAALGLGAVFDFQTA